MSLGSENKQSFLIQILLFHLIFLGCNFCFFIVLLNFISFNKLFHLLLFIHFFAFFHSLGGLCLLQKTLFFHSDETLSANFSLDHFGFSFERLGEIMFFDEFILFLSFIFICKNIVVLFLGNQSTK